MHKNGLNNNNNSQFLVTSNGVTPEGLNHVVHPTVVRANIPFKRKVNEVKRAATKAKRAAKSQLGRPYKKSGEGKKTTVRDTVGSPTDPDKTTSNVAYGKVVKAMPKSRDKERLSSRFSIISFRPFKPKSSSPEKKTNKVYDRRRSAIPGGRRTKSKMKTRSKSPDKKRKMSNEGFVDARSRSPTKKEERKKSKVRASSPEKRHSSPEKSRKQHKMSPDRNLRLGEGNWLINKFLADEEKIAKPQLNGSLAGSLTSIHGSPVSGTASGSPISQRHGSTRALLASMGQGSPIRGIVNEAFISSPRNARTHSSLRVGKVANLKADDGLYPSKYRRSISIGVSSFEPPIHGMSGLNMQEKRKKSYVKEENIEKRRRFSSPEKAKRLSPKADDKPTLSSPNSNSNESLKIGHHRRSSESLPPSANSSFANFALVPEKIRGKISLLGTSNSSSRRASIVSESKKSCSTPSSSIIGQKKQPKDWV